MIYFKILLNSFLFFYMSYIYFIIVPALKTLAFAWYRVISQQNESATTDNIKKVWWKYRLAFCVHSIDIDFNRSVCSTNQKLIALDMNFISVSWKREITLTYLDSLPFLLGGLGKVAYTERQYPTVLCFLDTIILLTRW